MSAPAAFSVRTMARAAATTSPSRSLASMRMNVPSFCSSGVRLGFMAPPPACRGDAWRPRSVYLLAVYLLETPRNYPPSFLDSLYLLRGSKQ
jgi:hypothetical protein